MNISSSMVVAARHWRKICQTTLVNYGISEACAIGRLGEWGLGAFEAADNLPLAKP